jgi:hypothetical protein
LNQDSEQRPGYDRAQSAANHRLKRATQRLAGETLEPLGEMVDPEQEEAQSAYHRDNG